MILIKKFLPDEKIDFSGNADKSSENSKNSENGKCSEDAKKSEDGKKNKEDGMVKDTVINNRFENIKAAFPDLNMEAGLTYCSNSEDFYAELLKDLAVSGKKEELQSAYDKRDWKLYGIKAHALKGAAKTLGLERLREVSEQLQTAAENADVDSIEKNHGKAVSMLGKLAECTKNM